MEVGRSASTVIGSGLPIKRGYSSLEICQTSFFLRRISRIEKFLKLDFCGKKKFFFSFRLSWFWHSVWVCSTVRVFPVSRCVVPLGPALPCFAQPCDSCSVSYHWFRVITAFIHGWETPVTLSDLHPLGLYPQTSAPSSPSALWPRPLASFLGGFIFQR